MSERQFVAFRVGKELFGVDINFVNTISEYIEIKKVPNPSSQIEGVINLRGEIIPVVSLKRKFEMEDGKVDVNTRIIIFKLADKVIGFLVDEASQVVRIQNEHIEPAPTIIKGPQQDYIEGVGKLDHTIIFILDAERMIKQFAPRDEIASNVG